MNPIHIVDGVCPERPSHQEVGPGFWALLGHGRAHPWHVPHPMTFLNLQQSMQMSAATTKLS